MGYNSNVVIGMFRPMFRFAPHRPERPTTSPRAVMSKLEQMIKEEQIPIIKEEYLSQFDTLQGILDSTIRELNELLDNPEHNIEIPIYGRVKSETSLDRKYDELRFEIKSIQQIKDLMGIRIVCLLLQDVEKIISKIKKKYPDFKEHYNPAEKSVRDKFNYNSNHIIIDNDGFHIEIQIRTLSQHTWAQVSRKFNYKNEIDVPQEITRPLFRASAHLESVDIDLDKFVDDRGKYLTHLEEQNIEDILDEKLNFDTLRITLAAKIPEKYKGESDELLYFSLIRELRSMGIDTVQKLVNLIDEELESAEKKSQTIARNILTKIENGKETGFDEDRIRNGVRFTYVGMIRTMYENYKRKENPAHIKPLP